MKIGIFGGAFNPPHAGHVEAAKKAADQNNLDLLIVIPTGVSPHKSMPHGTPPAEMRLQMTENAFSGLKNTIVSDMEVFSKECNYTIDTVESIHKKYPGAEIFLLVGTDMYQSLDTWKSSDRLLNIVKPILLPRDLLPVSSSIIRELLPKRKLPEHLTQENYSFIIKNRLYDAKPDWSWLQSKAYSMLEEKRIPHVKGCEEAAIKLAIHWGADVNDAREAAILHDITKKLDFDENMCIIVKYSQQTENTLHGIFSCNYSIEEAKLLHSLTGAILAKTIFGVSDAVANAIKLHTTGCANMTILDKIIYVADYIEATRDFPGVDDMRLCSFKNIDSAMIMGLKMVVDDLISRGITPNKSTYQALDSLGA